MANFTLTLDMVQIAESVPNDTFDSDSGYVGDGSSGGTDRNRLLFKPRLAELNAMAGYTASSATFQVFESGAGGAGSWDTNLYELIKAFTESEATWNRASAGVNWTQAGADDVTPVTGDRKDVVLSTVTLNGTAANAYVQWPTGVDMVALIQSWIQSPVNAKGIIMKSPQAESVGVPAAFNTFHSDTGASPPQILIVAELSDSEAPAAPSNFQAVAGDTAIALSWTNPLDGDFAGTKVVRKEGGFPSSHTDGVQVYSGTGTSHNDTGRTNGVEYFYAAYAYDEIPNYSTPAQDSATPTAAPSAPEVTLHPSPASKVVGQTATFVSTASGNPLPTCSWERGISDVWSPLEGETDTTLSVPSVSLDMSGYQYRAVFTNSEGTDTSDAATLTVTEADVSRLAAILPRNLDGRDNQDIDGASVTVYGWSGLSWDTVVNAQSMARIGSTWLWGCALDSNLFNPTEYVFYYDAWEGDVHYHDVQVRDFSSVSATVDEAAIANAVAVQSSIAAALANMDTTVSSRLATTDYSASPSADDIADAVVAEALIIETAADAEAARVAAQSAVTAVGAIDVTAGAAAALVAYDPPTRDEVTLDKNELLSAIAGLVEAGADADTLAAKLTTMLEGTGPYRFTAAALVNGTGVDSEAVETACEQAIADAGVLVGNDKTELLAGMTDIQTHLDTVESDMAAVKADTVAILEDTGTTIPASLTDLHAHVDTVETTLSDIHDDLNGQGADWTAITHNTIDDSGQRIGKFLDGETPLPGVQVWAYVKTDPVMTRSYYTTSDGDGGFVLDVRLGATYVVTSNIEGHTFPDYEVTV